MYSPYARARPLDLNEYFFEKLAKGRARKRLCCFVMCQMALSLALNYNLVLVLSLELDS